jgi:hypothetical protein
MDQTEFNAGLNQTLVVYSSVDDGSEIVPSAAFEAIAKDAEERAASGWRIVSTAAVPVRHAAAFMGRDGSGYETKFSVAVVYSHA